MAETFVDLNGIIQSILAGKPIDTSAKRFLLNANHQHGLSDDIAVLFQTAQSSLGPIATVRRLASVTHRAMTHGSINTFLSGAGVSLGIGQAALEFVALVDLLRKKDKKLSHKDAIKIVACVVGMIALTISSVGLGGLPLIAAAQALRGLTGAIRSLIRQREHREKLKAVEEALLEVKDELNAAFIAGQLSPEESEALCLRYLKLEEERKKIANIVDSKLINATEHLSQAANLLVICGAIMTLFPAFAPVGIVLMAIGTAAKCIMGFTPLVQQFKSIKTQFAKNKEPSFIQDAITPDGLVTLQKSSKG
jgi:hypothetical protein